MQSHTNYVSFVSRNVACRVSRLGWRKKIYITVFEGERDVPFWPDMSSWPDTSWIYVAQYHRCNLRRSMHQSFFFSNSLNLCKMSI